MYGKQLNLENEPFPLMGLSSLTECFYNIYNFKNIYKYLINTRLIIEKFNKVALGIQVLSCIYVELYFSTLTLNSNGNSNPVNGIFKIVGHTTFQSHPNFQLIDMMRWKFNCHIFFYRNMYDLFIYIIEILMSCFSVYP